LTISPRNGRDGLGLIEGKTFFPFAYDWRADNRSSADSLERFIRQVIKDKRLRFIAHSMGGIVTRLMLKKHKDLLVRTDVLFQVASPIGGSAVAFAALNGSNGKPQEGQRGYWSAEPLYPPGSANESTEHFLLVQSGLRNVSHALNECLLYYGNILLPVLSRNKE
jgi:pimeloyl-ACP methyl ester carboxylesterase